MKLPKFLIGLLIGGLLAIIVWYWQKSTSAEDGALEVLDRMASSEARVRDLEAQLRLATAPAPAPPVSQRGTPTINEIPGDERPPAAYAADSQNLQEISGIGPTYARRLHEAGVTTFAELSQLTPQNLMEITAVRSEQTAEAWINAARQRGRD